MNRRQFINRSSLTLSAVGGLFSPVASASVSSQEGKSLSLSNIHTGEKVTATYWEHGEYLTDGMLELNRLLRDFRANEVCVMDPALFNILHGLRQQMPGSEPMKIISGYRSPATNEKLRNHSTGVAKKSYHMSGKALDFAIPGYSLADTRKAIIAMRSGGVGYYPGSGFLHVDTGPVRYW